MDQSVIITPYSISFPPRNGGEAYSQTFMYRPPRDDLLSRRGELFALLTMQPVPEELDAPALAKDIFDHLQKDYFGNIIGGVLEALETAAHQALQRGGQHAHTYVNLQMTAVAIWGKAFYYYRTPQIYLGQIQGGELLDLDQHQVGSDALQDGDLIVLATPTFTQRIFKPFLQEQAHSLNVEEQLPELREKVAHLENPSSASAVLLGVSVAEVPSEEEVIEIEIAEERGKHSNRGLLAKLPKLSDLRSINPSHLAQIFKQRRGVEKPEIYLRPRMPQGKKGRLTLALFFATLLITSSIITYKYNQRQQLKEAAREKLQQTQEKIVQAEEVAALDPQQAQQLISSVEEDLGEVLGVSEELRGNVEEVRERATAVTAKIYRAEVVQAQPVQFPKQLDEKSFSIDAGRGVVNRSGEVLLAREDAWQTPVAAAVYFDNLYVLDTGANQIHKYLSIPSGYSNRRDYLISNVNLTNAVDLAIDGSIYVLFGDGRIEKYTAGERDEFHLDSFHPPFESPRLLETQPNTEHLYFAQDNTLLIFNKDGQYQRQLKVENATINDLILSDDESRLWLLSNDKWSEITL